MNYPELKIASLLFMTVLLIWSLFWIGYATLRLRKAKDRKLLWQTHIVWSLINVIIAGFSLITTAQTDIFTLERATLLRNIVAINIFLDLVYITIALALKKSENMNKQDIGHAVFIQGMFLLLIDTAIVLTFLTVMAE